MAAVTRLGLYGGPRSPYASFAGKAEAVVVPTKTGGRSRKRRRYVVEVDGQYIEVSNVSEAQAVLQHARALAEESANRDVTTEVVVKPPRVTVKTGSGKATTSQVIQREVKQTQKAINRAYIQAAERIKKERAVIQEISSLMQKKIRDEDDEERILALLL